MSARAFGGLIPSGGCIVMRRLVIPYLKESEHTAHADGAKGAFPCHHREGVFWCGHLHSGHIVHAACSHFHIIGMGHEGLDVFCGLGLVNPGEYR